MSRKKIRSEIAKALKQLCKYLTYPEYRTLRIDDDDTAPTLVKLEIKQNGKIYSVWALERDEDVSEN